MINCIYRGIPESSGKAGAPLCQTHVRASTVTGSNWLTTLHFAKCAIGSGEDRQKPETQWKETVFQTSRYVC